MEKPDLQQALGPLASLYNDPEVMEIMVDSPAQIFIERHNKIEETNVHFDSKESLTVFIKTLFELVGAGFTEEQTINESSLGKTSHMVAALPPTAVDGPYIVIRKFIKRALNWDDLINWNSISREAFDFIKVALAKHLNILVAGGTNSGKTTLMNMVAELIPSDERLVIVEGIEELHIQHPRLIELSAGHPVSVTKEDLLNTASKMRPDWIIINELQGSEVMRVLEIMSRGYSAMTTIHATSCEDALTRLETMCLMGNLGLGLAEIRILIASAIQMITFQKWMPDRSRKMLDIVELRGVENDRYILQPLFQFDNVQEKLLSTGIAPSW